MFDAMDDRGFVEFLAALWEERGWETGITEDEPGVYMITGDQASGKRGLMLVVPGTGAKVPGKRVQTVASICDAKNVDLGVVATRGTFSDDAQRIGEANDVHLLDQAALTKTVEAEGMQDLVEAHIPDDESLLDRIPVPEISTPSPPPIPSRGLTVLLLIVGIVGAALVGMKYFGISPDIAAMVPIDGLGLGGGGGGFTVTAVSLTSGNGTAVDVAWNTNVQSTVVTPDGQTYSAPEGETFVVVQMNVTNDGDSTAIIRERTFGFAANNTRHGMQRLEGAAGQPPIPVTPGATESVWVAFSIDEGADSGTVLGLPGEDTPPIRFHHDEALELQVSA